MNLQEKERKDFLDAPEFISTKDCPVCGGNSKLLLTMPTINPRAKDRVELRECTSCKHWWHNPLLKQQYLSKLYADDSEFVVGLHALAKLHKPEERELLTAAEPMLKDFAGRNDYNYLEIGSGSGCLVDFFRKYAHLSFGVEPSRIGNQPNIVSDIDDLPEGIKFGCVVMQDVLEHMSDPVLSLKKIIKKAKPEAVLYAGFPNKDSFKAKFMKDKWSMMRPVGHLHYFSAKSIDAAFKNAGWKVVEKRPVRMGDMNAWKVLKWFDYKAPNLPYRLIKSLLLGQLILGKDQWKVKAIYE